MDIRTIIEEELRTANSSSEALSLWNEIAQVFEESGPDGVKEVIANRVKDARKRASKEAKEMTNVAGTVAKPKKKGRK